MGNGWGTGRRAGYVVGGTGVVLVGALAAFEMIVRDTGRVYLWEQMLFGAVIGGAAFLAAVLALRERGRESRVWLLISAACASVLTSQLYWTWVITATGTAPLPLSISNVFDFLAIALVIVLLKTMVVLPGSKTSVWRHAIDAAGLLMVSTMILYVYVIAPWFADIGDTTAWEGVIGALYPVLGVVILTGTITILVGPKIRLWNRWEHLIAWGMLLLSTGMVLWPMQHAAALLGSGPGTTIVDVLWAGGMFLVFGAAVYRFDSGGHWAIGPLGQWHSSSVHMTRFVVPVLYAGSAMLLGFRAARDGAPGVSAEVLAGCAAAIALVFIVRSLLVAMETRELVAEARTDVATGVGDYRAFLDELPAVITIAARYGTPVSVAMMDVDHMTRFTDVHGRSQAASLLRDLARLAGDACGGTGSVFRVGANGFAVVFEGKAGKVASNAVLALREALAERNRVNGTPVTFSAGIASFPDDADDTESLLTRAETALWWAKANGRDRVVVHDDTVATSEQFAATGLGMGRRAQQGLSSIAVAVDMRYDGMRDHSVRVATLARLLAMELSLSEERIRVLEQAALLHDVGMITVPDELLLQRQPLSVVQWEGFHDHPVLGERIIRAAGLEDAAGIVREHHERWDGTGYPDGLCEQAIMLEARILAVCEAFDAMTSIRPYRAALSVSAALQQIDLGISTQFDPIVAEAFIRMVSRDDLLGPSAEELRRLLHR